MPIWIHQRKMPPTSLENIPVCINTINALYIPIMMVMHTVGFIIKWMGNSELHAGQHGTRHTKQQRNGFPFMVMSFLEGNTDDRRITQIVPLSSLIQHNREHTALLSHPFCAMASLLCHHQHHIFHTKQFCNCRRRPTQSHMLHNDMSSYVACTVLLWIREEKHMAPHQIHDTPLCVICVCMCVLLCRCVGLLLATCKFIIAMQSKRFSCPHSFAPCQHSSFRRHRPNRPRQHCARDAKNNFN